MKRGVNRIFAFTALIAILVFGVWFLWPSHEQAKDLNETSSVERMVQTSRPVRRNFSKRLFWFGRVRSKRVVRIVSLTPGEITSVGAADGAFVTEGKALFTIGGPRVTLKLQLLAHRVSALEKQVALARNLVRIRRVAVSEKVAKKQDLLVAEEHLAQLSRDMATARQELFAYKDMIVLSSPMDGIFTNRQVSTGQEVAKGTYLADLISREQRIIARLYPPPDVSLVGKRVEIQVSSRIEVTGHITRVLPQYSLEGATIVWIESDEINNFTKPGEVVSGWIVLETRNRTLAVPKRAIVRDEHERTFVFVKMARGYQKKPVKIGLTDRGWCEIVLGLSGSEEVVVRGAYELFYRNFKKTYKVPD